MITLGSSGWTSRCVSKILTPPSICEKVQKQQCRLEPNNTQQEVQENLIQSASRMKWRNESHKYISYGFQCFSFFYPTPAIMAFHNFLDLIIDSNICVFTLSFQLPYIYTKSLCRLLDIDLIFIFVPLLFSMKCVRQLLQNPFLIYVSSKF